MTGIFKRNNSYNSFLLLVYAVLLRLYVFSHPSPPVFLHDDGFVYKQFFRELNAWNLPAIVYSLAAFVLLFAQALALNRITVSRRLMPSPNYLPGMTYLLLTSLLPEMNRFSSVLVFNSIVILMVAGMAKIQHAASPKSRLFNLGMLAGSASLVFFPGWILVPLLLTGALLYRSIVLREWLIILLGIIAPYYFLLALLFLFGDISVFSFHDIRFSLPHVKIPDAGKIIAGCCGLLLISGYYYLQKGMVRLMVQSRKFWVSIYFLFVLCLSGMLATRLNDPVYLLCTALPVAWISSNAFFYPKSARLTGLLHWSLVGMALYIQIRGMA